MSDCVSSSLNSSLHIHEKSIFLSVASSGQNHVSIINTFITNTTLIDYFSSVRNIIFSKVIMAKYVDYFCVFHLAFCVLWNTNVAGSYC